MKMLLEKRDRSKYYHFYHDYRHNIKDCQDLKEQSRSSFVKGTLEDLFEDLRNLHPDL